MQFSLAVTKMVHGNIETLDKEVRDRLDTKLFALMGEKAITMHGNAEALGHMKAKLEPLAQRLDYFARNPEMNIASEAFESMRLELNDAKMAFETLARDGYKVGDGRVIPDKAFMDAAKEILAQVEKRKQKAVFNDPDDQKPRLEPKFNAMPDNTLTNFNDIVESIAQLTQGNYKRNGFSMSAKDGWFN